MPIHSDSSAPVLFFNMPLPVQRLWLTCWGNKNLVLGGTGERGDGGGGGWGGGIGDFTMWEGDFFFQMEGMTKFVATCPLPPSGMENPG